MSNHQLTKRGKGSRKQEPKKRIVHEHPLINQFTDYLYLGAGKYDRNFMKTLHLRSRGNDPFFEPRRLDIKISFNDRNILQIEDSANILWKAFPWQQVSSFEGLQINGTEILETDLQKWELFWQMFGGSMIRQWLHGYTLLQKPPVIRKKWYHKKETWPQHVKSHQYRWLREEQRKVEFYSNENLWGHLKLKRFHEYMLSNQKIFN